jgi:thiamine-phosphate pyrophosphorylase
MLNPETLRLVAITDGVRGGASEIVQRALACVRGGATMVQLRLKDADARTQVEVARALIAALPARIPIIMNDRADLAIAAGAAGVHVGPEDLPAAAVRRILGPARIVGVSVGNDAEALQASDADYVGIGPVYATASKGDAGSAIGVAELARLIALCARPAVGIGGIDATNAAAVIDAGARGVAVIRALFSAADPEEAARSLRSAIGM